MPSVGRGERDGLRVVAGADRDHAAPLLLGREAAELVQRAAGLEGAGALEELALEPGAERAARRAAGCAGAGRRSSRARARRRRASAESVSHAGAELRRAGGGGGSPR